MIIAKNIAESMNRSSWIRKMFEDGAKLKAIYGEENVFDFSLGNPNLPPPPEFHAAVRELIEEEPPGVHGYMPNAGFPQVRQAVAEHLSSEQGMRMPGDIVIRSVGAGGALNSVLRAIIDPGDEIIVPKPFFVEYVSYAANHGGVLKTVETVEDFDISIEKIEEAITENTRAILINSPNNPTGKVYSEANLRELAELMETKSRELGREIYLIADEPYRAIIFDGVDVPPIFPIFKRGILCSSFSKTLSLAGERIGYVAVNPEMEDAPLLVNALTLTTRILGFVNAPAFIQRVFAKLMEAQVDIDYYRTNRDILYDGLTEAGYKCRKPEGAFYLFPESPLADDAAFCQMLLEEKILAVPGSGFMGPGYFRLAYCCSRETCENALPGFKRVLEKVK